jgi:hypothetical protein
MFRALIPLFLLPLQPFVEEDFAPPLPPPPRPAMIIDVETERTRRRGTRPGTYFYREKRVETAKRTDNLPGPGYDISKRTLSERTRTNRRAARRNRDYARGPGFKAYLAPKGTREDRCGEWCP